MAILCCICVYPALLILALVGIRLLLEKLKIKDLRSKPVFITGCDSGFGKWLSLKLLENGIPVFAGCLTEKGQDELRKEAKSLPGHLASVALDVTKQDSVDKAVNYVKEQIGQEGLWALVNNAGILGNFGTDDFMTVNDYQQVLDVNTLGAIRCTQAFKPLIKKSKGRIVMMSSIAGRVSGPSVAPYAVSKFALEAYSDSIRHELLPYKVGVYILEPGWFKTKFTDAGILSSHFKTVWDQASPETQHQHGESYLEKFQERTANSLEFFCSSKTDFVVDAAYHALTAVFPRKRYWVGYDSMFFFIPISMLPTCLQDFVVQAVKKFLKVPDPEM